MGRLLQLLLGLGCVCITSFGQKADPRPSPIETDNVFREDFVLNAHRARKVRSTVVLSDLVNLSDQNITDTRLSEFLIKVENVTSIGNTTVTDNRISVKLSQNKLTSLQSDYFASIKNLHELDVSQNRIVSIRLGQALPHLRVLNVSHNNLFNFSSTSTLPSTSSPFPQLQILDLSCNKFNGTRNLAIPNSIKMLDLSNNRIATVDDQAFLNLSQLVNLDISFNVIGTLGRDAFAGLARVEILNVAANQIRFIDNDTFLPMPNLQFLDVSQNDIQIGVIRALQGIPKLIGLSIAYNEELSESLQGFVTTWTLKELDASGIGLCEIPAALTQSVKHLNLAHNNLQVIRCGDLDSYPLLHKLVLSSNELRAIEDDALGRLEIITHLYLENNRLDQIPISLPSSLIELHLGQNIIAELHANTLTQLRSLEYLSLSGNPIIYLPGLPLPQLVKLEIRACRLENVNQALVKMSPHLKDIFLEDNPVKCADLLGIAEWATPCRENTLLDSGTTTTVSYEDDYVRRGGHVCDKKVPERKKEGRTKKKICHIQPLGGLEFGQQSNDKPSVNDNEEKSVAQSTVKRKQNLGGASVSKKNKMLKRNKSLSEKHLQLATNSLTQGSKGHKFEEHFDDIQHPFDRQLPPQNCTVNGTYSAERWASDNASLSQVTGHPGLFMVIGVTIGMITAFGLVHLYRRPHAWRYRRRRFEMNNFATIPNATTPQHHDLLHMDRLTSGAPASQSPIELW